MNPEGVTYQSPGFLAWFDTITMLICRWLGDTAAAAGSWRGSIRYDTIDCQVSFPILADDLDDFLGEAKRDELMQYRGTV